MAIESHADEWLVSPQVRTRNVLLSALAFLMLLGAAIGLLDVIYYRQIPIQSFPAPETFPQPRVQTGQRAQLRDLQKQQLSRLHGYRWVDRENGLIEIPIVRAMQLLAGEGMQAYASLAPAPALSVPAAGAERLQTPQAAAPGGATPVPAGGKP